MTMLLDDRLLPVLPPDYAPWLGERRSELMNYLPAVYAEDIFMNRFLCIFEDTLKPLQQFADNLHYYFNPLIAPPEMVNWLATWVNLALDESWDDEKRRKLIGSATELYSRRGTKRGLIEYLKLYTGVEPQLDEYVDGMVLGPETRLGINTTIAGSERHSFTVTLQFDKDVSGVKLRDIEAMVRRIIDAEKPAHTTYRLRLLTKEVRNGQHKELTGQTAPLIEPKPEPNVSN